MSDDRARVIPWSTYAAEDQGLSPAQCRWARPTLRRWIEGYLIHDHKEMDCPCITRCEPRKSSLATTLSRASSRAGRQRSARLPQSTRTPTDIRSTRTSTSEPTPWRRSMTAKRRRGTSPAPRLSCSASPGLQCGNATARSRASELDVTRPSSEAPQQSPCRKTERTAALLFLMTTIFIHLSGSLESGRVVRGAAEDDVGS